MSLEYRNEEADETRVGEAGQFQQAQPVFPIYSVIFIVFLIGVSLCQFAVDGTNAVMFGGEKSVLLAGFVKPFFADGQYWRILTGAVLHAGLVHLAFNCYALYIFGKLIETLSNRAHLPVIFLLAAFGGGVLSFIFLPDGVSVGASGGILGFLGYLAAYGFLRRKVLTNAFLKNMLFNIGFIALYGIFLNRSVDNFAHLGGLIAGALYGLVQIPKDLYEDPRNAGETMKYLGFAALGIFILVCLFSALVIFKIL